MNVLSLFDGMSCGRIALERANIKIDKYYASEIDKYATQVSEKNYPDIIRLGDVTKWREWDINWGSIDLLLAGSPCQGFSFAGKQLAFDDTRSRLFFVFIDILNHIKKLNPDVKFLLENVRMKKEYLDVISRQVGVEPVMINSALVSAQNRKRYYWTNIVGLSVPQDIGVTCGDIIDGSNDKPNSDGWIIWWEKNKEFQLRKKYSLVMNNEEKAITQTARQMSSWNGNLFQTSNGKMRFASPLECERLQTVPDNYTDCVSNTQRYKMLGNGWTVDVIAHILKNIK